MISGTGTDGFNPLYIEFAVIRFNANAPWPLFQPPEKSQARPLM